MRNLDLFNYDMKPPKKITYAELSIHQKINYKANKGNCFYGTIYLSRYYYFHQELFQPVTDRLTKKYWVEYRLNAGGFNRLDTWRAEKQKNKKRSNLFE